MAGSYTVGRGDSWASIAGRVYGNQRYLGELQRANRHIGTLQPGDTIFIPDVGGGAPPVVTEAELSNVWELGPEAQAVHINPNQGLGAYLAGFLESRAAAEAAGETVEGLSIYEQDELPGILQTREEQAPPGSQLAELYESFEANRARLAGAGDGPPGEPVGPGGARSLYETEGSLARYLMPFVSPGAVDTEGLEAAVATLAPTPTTLGQQLQEAFAGTLFGLPALWSLGTSVGNVLGGLYAGEVARDEAPPIELIEKRPGEGWETEEKVRPTLGQQLPEAFAGTLFGLPANDFVWSLGTDVGKDLGGLYPVEVARDEAPPIDLVPDVEPREEPREDTRRRRDTESARWIGLQMDYLRRLAEQELANYYRPLDYNPYRPAPFTGRYSFGGGGFGGGGGGGGGLTPGAWWQNLARWIIT